MAKQNAIRAFRSAVAKLKKKGLIDPSIDARSVKPTRSLEKKLSTFRYVLSGEAASVKLSKEETRKKKQQGFQVVKAKGQAPRVIVPTYEGEKVNVSHGRLKVLHKSGVEEIDIDVDINNPESLRRWARRNKARIDGMKRNGEAFAFKLKGYHSWDTYGSIDKLVDRLLKYDIFQSPETGNKYFEDGIEALQIVKLDKKYGWHHGPGKAARPPRVNKYAREKARTKRQPKYIQEMKKEAAAQRSREYRASLKGAALEQYKADAKKRAKKARKSKKK